MRLRRGSGTDVAGSRPYRPGDDMDAIDWAASARISTARGSDEFVVRERFAEEAPKVVVVCDRRLGMACFPATPHGLQAAGDASHFEPVLASAAGAGGFVGYLDQGGRRLLLGAHRRSSGSRSSSRTSGSSPRTSGLRQTGSRAPLPTSSSTGACDQAGTFVFVLSGITPPPPSEVWLTAAEHRWDLVRS